jgi:hypothetical protein
MEATIVNVRDISSGRIHRRFQIEGTKELAAFEADNADEAGEYALIWEDSLADAPTESFCKRCFPELFE